MKVTVRMYDAEGKLTETRVVDQDLFPHSATMSEYPNLTAQLSAESWDLRYIEDAMIDTRYWPNSNFGLKNKLDNRLDIW